MLHPEDHQKLERILRTSTFSQSLLTEYDIRLRMFHACGASGPLGALGLIDLVRSLKLTPVVPEVVPEKIDWRLIPRNGKVRVKAKFFDSWVGGTYFGFGEDGTLEVQMDHEERRRHMPRHALRLADEEMVGRQAPTGQPTEDAPEVVTEVDLPVSDTPDTLAEADTDVYEEFLQAPVPTAVQRPERPSIPIPSGDDDTPYQQHDGGVLDEISSSDAVAVISAPVANVPSAAVAINAGIDWQSIEVGRVAWVEADDDLLDAKFQGVAEDGYLSVLIDGEDEPRTVLAEKVNLS